MFAFTLSHDGKELFAIANPTLMLNDRYEVQQPRLDVYATDAGMDAKPVRSFPAPRQLTIMQSGDDGTLYVAGADIYKVDVKTGKFDVLIPSRHWKRANYAAPDVLYVWNQQTYRHDFSLLYTTAKFKDKKQDPATADYLYGLFSVDLKTGKTETTDFGPLTEIYFSGMRSPKDPNLMFGVLNRLAKYDIKEKKMLQAATLDHSYYCISFNKDGSKIYLAGTFNDVAIFDADSLKQVGSIKLPGGYGDYDGSGVYPVICGVWADAFAGKPAPTGSRCAQITVGAGLPAMRPSRPLKIYCPGTGQLKSPSWHFR